MTSTKISKTRFFQYGGQTILTRSLAVIGVTRVTPIRNVLTTELTSMFQALAGEVKTRERSGWTRLRFVSRRTTKPTEWRALSEDSDQPGQPPSLIRVVAFLRTQSFITRTANSDQTGRMPWLIWVFAGRTSFCWFCHAAAHITLRETKTETWSLFWSVDKFGRQTSCYETFFFFFFGIIGL